jgi:hypothetical protein
MPTKSYLEFATQYQQMPDGQLLLLANEGGLVEEAQQALAEELRKRNLKKQDIAQHERKTPHERLQEAAQEKSAWWGGTGTGYYFYGKHYLNEDDKTADIQLRTKWFALGGIPLVPLASYRFKCEQKSFGWLRWNTEQRILNRVALNWDQIFLTWLKSILFGVTVLGATILYYWLRQKMK